MRGLGIIGARVLPAPLRGCLGQTPLLLLWSRDPPIEMYITSFQSSNRSSLSPTVLYSNDLLQTLFNMLLFRDCTRRSFGTAELGARPRRDLRPFFLARSCKALHPLNCAATTTYHDLTVYSGTDAVLPPPSYSEFHRS